jgi:hypothetical protein
MEMCGNGAGTGMVIIQTRISLILRAPPRGLTAFTAAGAGAIRPGTFVPRTGTTAARAAGATALVSGLSAPQFNGKGQARQSEMPAPSDRRERRQGHGIVQTKGEKVQTL